MGGSTQSSGGGRRGSRPRKGLGSAIAGAITSAGDATGVRMTDPEERARKRIVDQSRDGVVKRRRTIRKLLRRRS